MNAERTAQPGGESPPEPKLKQRKRYSTAAGFKALLEVAEYGFRQSGVKNTIRTAHKLNQTDGFDCQSCAWPNPDGERSPAEFCENGFKAVTYETTKKRVTREFFQQHTVAELAEKTEHWLGEQGRITEPMVLRPRSQHYEPIDWASAFQLVAKELKALSSPNEAIFYTSGRTSNETAFLYQLFVRAFGTNNMPDCSNMCHESTSVALPPMIGIGKGCVKLSDFEKADAIFIIGQNPGTNHPRMLTALQHAKERGCKIVSVNPLPETGNFRFKNPQDLLHPLHVPRFLFGTGTQLSDLWLQVMINGDMAFLQGLMKELLEEEDRRKQRRDTESSRISPSPPPLEERAGERRPSDHPSAPVFDYDFIRQHTIGFEDLIAQLRKISWEQIVADSGLTREQIRQAAEIVLGAHRIIVCWCMGLTQHKNAVATVQEVVNFLLLRGNIGRPGAGPCPVRGHSNVQGDRTMGIWDKPKPKFLDALEREFGFKPPREHGFDTVEAITAMHEGRAKVFFAMGGNFAGSPSDTGYTIEALKKCQLTAHVSIKLNRSHFVTGECALILPCLGRTEIDRQAGGEQFMTVEDSMGVINPTRGNLEPVSDNLLSEVGIVAELAKVVLGAKTPIDWDAYVANYDLIRDKIEAVVPGFPSFNDRIREGTFYLPNPPRDERRFETPSGKAVFMPHPLSRVEIPPDKYLMTTIRSHDQFNTSIYGLDDRYRGIYNGRHVIFMNEEDMREAKLMQGQYVDLTSHFEGQERHVKKFMVAPYPIPRRCVATYYPESNPLVANGSVAEQSNCPASKSVIISITPSV